MMETRDYAREGAMRKRISSTNGEAELLKGRDHVAYCKYLINEFKEDDGRQTTEASLSLMREGMRDEEFKKLALFLVFNRNQIYNLRFPDGSSRNVSMSEFNAFSAEGKMNFVA
jgi:hypothetical protein